MTTPLPDDRGMDQALHRWMHDDDVPPTDRTQQIADILRRVAETKPRRRLWPLYPFGRRAMHRADGVEAHLGSTRGGVVVALTPLRDAHRHRRRTRGRSGAALRCRSGTGCSADRGRHRALSSGRGPVPTSEHGVVR